jgi:hypothetical protein
MGRWHEPPHDWPTESEEDYEVARLELKRRFAQWRAADGAELDEDAGEAPIHYKWAFLDGHLTRWRCRDLDEIYLELHPAKVMVDDDDLDEVLEEAKAFISFLAETGLLDADSEPPDVLVEHLGRIEEQFRHNMADSSRYSFGKRLWTAALGEGVRLDDRASVEAFMADFNARPIAERDAILSPGLPPRPAATGRFTPPGTRPRAPSAKRRKCGKASCRCAAGAPHESPALSYSVAGRTKILRPCAPRKSKRWPGRWPATERVSTILQLRPRSSWTISSPGCGPTERAIDGERASWALG